MHTLLLRSDGGAVACGYDPDGRASPPPPLTYYPGDLFTAVSAGGFHSLLCDASGMVHAFGGNYDGQAAVPMRAFMRDVRVVQISAGFRHSAVLMSDGQAFAWGLNDDGQCDIPVLQSGQTYLSVSAGLFTTVLLRSDNILVQVGEAVFDHCLLGIAPIGASISDTGGIC